MKDKKESPTGESEASNSYDQIINPIHSETNENVQGNSSPQQSSGIKTELATILDQIEEQFGRYLSLPKGAARMIALWVAHTHSLRTAEITPRLAFLSAIPGCGKSTALKMLLALVQNGMWVTNTSAPALFRMIPQQAPTLLLDELDSYADGKGDMTNILNSGFEKGAKVLRCDANTYAPTEFETYAAVAIGKIGSLPKALESRSIIINMRPPRRDERVERFTDSVRSDLHKIRQRLAEWAKVNCRKLVGANPSIPCEFRNRQADNLRHLLAIADQAAGEWPKKARSTALAVCGIEEPSLGERLLGNIAKIYRDTGKDRVTSLELCQLIKQLDPDVGTLDQNILSDVLRPFGIKPKTIRFGSQTLRGFERVQFEDAFARYLPAHNGKNP